MPRPSGESEDPGDSGSFHPVRPDRAVFLLAEMTEQSKRIASKARDLRQKVEGGLSPHTTTE